jgi:hypothetical protein
MGRLTLNTQIHFWFRHEDRQLGSPRPRHVQALTARSNKYEYVPWWLVKESGVGQAGGALGGGVGAGEDSCCGPLPPDVPTAGVDPCCWPWPIARLQSSTTRFTLNASMRYRADKDMQKIQAPCDVRTNSIAQSVKVAQLDKKFLPYMISEGSLLCLKKTHHQYPFWDKQSTPSYTISLIHINIILPYTPTSSKLFLPFRFSYQNFVCISHLRYLWTP